MHSQITSADPATPSTNVLQAQLPTAEPRVTEPPTGKPPQTWPGKRPFPALLGCREICLRALDGWATAPSANGGRLAFSGRLDNREELWRALPTGAALGATGDVDLVAQTYDNWGAEGFRRLLGPFAVALWDAARQTLRLVRDPLGGRSLSYSLTPGLLVAGSDPIEILAHPRIGDALDPRWLAAYFALEEPAEGRTPFLQIRELPPGHWLEVNAERAVLHGYWTDRDWLEAAGAAQPQTAEEIDEELRHRLHQAVGCRLQGIDTPAVLMSGGLDSVPIAAAARELLGATRRLVAVSWVFPEHPRADESQLIDQAARALKLDSIRLDCDRDLPLGDPASWPMHPATPEQNPYRRFHQRAYTAAAAAGGRVLLSGMCGDQLWTGAETWLGDALRRGRPGEAVRELCWQLRHRALIRPDLPPWLRAAHRRLRPASQFAWLTSAAQNLLASHYGRGYDEFPRPHQAKLLLGGANGHGFAVEAFYARNAGIELRYPLRDRRLIELALALPTAALYARGVERVAWRRALSASLPGTIARRRGKATFIDLFSAGIYQQSGPRVAELLFNPGAVWPEFVRPPIVRQAFDSRDTGFGGLQLWLALSLELWLEQRARSSFGVYAL